MIQQETLNILEWQKLCEHLATFAATKLGAIASRNIAIPETQTESLTLLNQTKEISIIENSLNPNWTFTGIHDIGEYLERAKIGSLLGARCLFFITIAFVSFLSVRDNCILSLQVSSSRHFPLYFLLFLLYSLHDFPFSFLFLCVDLFSSHHFV